MNKILLVEDDKYLNKLLNDRLSLEGFSVTSALDGDSAWSHLKEAKESGQPFELILSDMLLPRMMGAELFTKIRDNKEFSELKIMAMSGIYKDETQIKEISALHDLSAYFTKPFDINDVLEQLTGNPKIVVSEQTNLGSLKDKSIEKIFYQAYDRGFTGKLFLRNPNSERRIFFMNGFPVAAESTAVNESLGQSLVLLGLISDAQRESASEMMVSRRLQFGQVLIELKILTEAQLFDALRKHTYRLLLQTFMIKESQFEFEAMDALPNHVMILEFNPMLVILKAHAQIYKSDFIKTLYETKMDLHCHRHPRFFQVVPLFNLDEVSRDLILNFSNSENLESLLKLLPAHSSESFLRLFFALESLGLVAWRSQVAVDANPASPLDLREETVDASAGANEVARSLQAHYVKTLNRDYFEILEVSPDASEVEIAASYREIRYQLHPDRFGTQLNGQSKRILDDLLGRIDRAYQTLTNPSLREEYLGTVKRERAGSVEDSKKYLEAQNLFREGLRSLGNQDYAAALSRFEDAVRRWGRGVEYEAYATYSAFKLTMAANKDTEAQKIVQKLKDIAFQNSNSDIGFLLLGHAYLALRKTDQAREAYQRALSANERCDDAANALAGLGEVQLKKERLSHTVKKTKSTAARIGVVLVFAGTLGILFQFRDLIYYKDPEVEILNVQNYLGVGPLTSLRRKQDTVKVTAQSGWLKTVPDSVMKSKCSQLLLQFESLNISRIYWYDEEKGLKVYCYGSQIRFYK